MLEERKQPWEFESRLLGLQFQDAVVRRVGRFSVPGRRVSDIVFLDTAMALDLLPGNLLDLAQHRPAALIAEFVRERCRTDDIGEDDSDSAFREFAHGARIIAQSAGREAPVSDG